MPRVISPPLDQLASLKTPLNRGEQAVLEFFLKHTPAEWEIYIQPHLNGLRPDFVLLHPRVGVAVFEVKSWDLNALEYFTRPAPGGAPILMAKWDGKTFSRQDENPIDKICLYEQEIHELYCPRLDAIAGRAVITAGVIFSAADDDEVERLFRPCRGYHGMLRYPRYYPLSGRDALLAGDLEKIFPEATRTSSRYMTPELAQDLRSWLVEPSFAADQRRPLELDSTQRGYVTSRTTSGYRRIRGPAGSGKSIVLAARAAQLASEGREVLVISFNITLLNYLRDLAVRWVAPGPNVRRSVTWLNFHFWCKRVCSESGRSADYKALWKGADDDVAHARVLDHNLAQLVDEIIDADGSEHVQRYDAILVDEGQDFLPEWWSALRKVCTPGGEMLLIADQTQDVYGRARAWTEQVMTGAGFSGPWAELATSYRMPREMADQARRFAQAFLPPDTAVLPDPPQLDLSIAPCNLRWVQTPSDCAHDVSVEEILTMISQADQSPIPVADVTFLTYSRRLGEAVVGRLAGNGIKSLHTFAARSSDARRLKLAFFMGDARVKATTLHSFKGWESRALVIAIGPATSPEALALIYAGLTRLKRNEAGSWLTVVSSTPELEEYGRSWPTFRRVPEVRAVVCES